MQKTTASSKQQPTVRGVFTITPCLWFDRQAEDAAKFYVSLFPDSHIDKVVKAPADFPSGKKGDVLVVDFTLTGRKFSGLNGGPYFKLNEAVSFIIPCENQAEVDRYWKALSAVPESEQCGWVKDRYGLSWQIVPTMLNRLLADPDRAKAGRVMEAMLKMKKLDIAALERAAQGGSR
ncbi:MAG: VOC family protein [Bacillati bacterium ANGP1]|uniref:VOC family protein n=1 Tax=Candidatus Segetimicrobium genomatis TaxID=2569760 RepID=A0A537L7V5_9BACT|nr:MAG: VOC family protein [Terrabacteria group bacterium ANGP1]